MIFPSNEGQKVPTLTLIFKIFLTLLPLKHHPRKQKSEWGSVRFPTFINFLLTTVPNISLSSSTPLLRCYAARSWILFTKTKKVSDMRIWNPSRNNQADIPVSQNQGWILWFCYWWVNGLWVYRKLNLQCLSQDDGSQASCYLEIQLLHG